MRYMMKISWIRSIITFTQNRHTFEKSDPEILKPLRIEDPASCAYIFLMSSICYLESPVLKHLNFFGDINGHKLSDEHNARLIAIAQKIR